MRHALVLGLLLALGASVPAPAAVLTRTGHGTATATAGEELIVRFAPGATAAERREALARVDGEVVETIRDLPGTRVIASDDPRSRARTATALERHPAVLWAEPNARITGDATTPNDPQWSQLWGLRQIRAPEAWDRTTGGDVVVAVVDTGVAYDDPALAPNRYGNPGERGGGRETNGLDDDGNGKVDDWRGWDFASRDNDPRDLNGHGTHAAATIAARGDDGQGVAGVAWTAKVLALRALDARGSGDAADAAAAFAYAGERGADVVNASFSTSSHSQALADAVAAYPDTLFVVAASNQGADLAAADRYPCELPLENIVCVGATDSADALASFSNFGDESVDLAAPGVAIRSVLPQWQPFRSVDDFELASLTPAWERLGTAAPWGTTTESAGQGQRSLTDSPGGPYAPGADSWLRRGPLNFVASGETGCLMSLRYRTETPYGGDWLHVRTGYSPDRALPNSVLAVSGSSGGEWRSLVADLSFYAGPRAGLGPEFWLHVGFTSDGQDEQDGVWIDDLGFKCLAPQPDGSTFADFSGTSMATPHVSGVAALIKALRPQLTALDVRKALLDGAHVVPGLAGKTVTGGRLDAAAALAAAPAAPVGPVVETGEAVVQPGERSATVSGTVENATSWWVEYGPTTAYGARTAESSLQQVAVAIPGEPLETLHYRLVARSAGGTRFGADRAVRLLDLSVETGSATSSDRSARIGATIRTGGRPAEWHVDLATGDPRLGTVTRGPFPGGSGGMVHAVVSGLQARTTYSYRVRVTNAHGEALGAWRTITTTAEPVSAATEGPSTTMPTTPPRSNGAPRPSAAPAATVAPPEPRPEQSLLESTASTRRPAASGCTAVPVRVPRLARALSRGVRFLVRCPPSAAAVRLEARRGSAIAGRGAGTRAVRLVFTAATGRALRGRRRARFDVRLVADRRVVAVLPLVLRR